MRSHDRDSGGGSPGGPAGGGSPGGAARGGNPGGSARGGNPGGSAGGGNAGGTSSVGAEVPLGQRLYDSPFLLLLAGVLVMAITYTAWGLWEILTLPPAPLP